MTTLSAAAPYTRPPSADRLGPGLLLALLVHAGLLAGLASGVSWRQHTVPVVSAELWASVPRVADAAAAPDVAPPPPPPPPPQPVAPAPPPRAVAAPPPPPDAAALREAQIATEQRKAAERKALEREQAAKLAREKEAARLRAEEEKLAREKAARDKALREKQAAAEKAAAEKAAAEKKLADKKAADKAATDKQEKAEADRLQRLREANLARMRKELTSTPPGSKASGSAQPLPGRGSATTPGTGTAAQSAGPSAGYEGRIRARILPNIIYNGPRGGTPPAEVVVNVAPDGRIISSRLLKSSGVAEWDREVLRAIERTEVLPRDVDGRVPAQIILVLDPSER